MNSSTASLRSTIILILGVIAWAASTPPSMYIGTFAIDNYSNNGGGMGNLGQQVASALNMFWAAQEIIPGYTGHSLSPYHNTDKRNTDVTAAAFRSTSVGYSDREYSDFVGYFGHGLNTGFYLGAGTPYGLVTANMLSFGPGYNRFFFAMSCSIFNNPEGPAAHWSPAFKGLKAMLGFRSFMYDNNLQWDFWSDFWNGWSYQSKSLLNAFFDANADYGYKHLYPARGLEPGCLSAPVPVSTMDHCRLSFQYVAPNWNPATYGTGYYYFRKIGTPEY
jgi:hypothetical protein